MEKCYTIKKNVALTTMKNVVRWSKKVSGGSIFNRRYILFPININDMHWKFVVVFMEERCIRYYDLLPDGNKIHTEMRNGVLQYQKDEYKAITDGNERNVCEWDTLDCSS